MTSLFLTTTKAISQGVLLSPFVRRRIGSARECGKNNATTGKQRRLQIRRLSRCVCRGTILTPLLPIFPRPRRRRRRHLTFLEWTEFFRLLFSSANSIAADDIVFPPAARTGISVLKIVPLSLSVVAVAVGPSKADRFA